MNFETNNCVAIKVKNLEEAKKFYGEVLSLKLVSETDSLLEFETGNFCLYVEKDNSPQSPVPSFTVASSEAAKDRLLKNGCTIVKEFKGGFWFKDPFGITYDIIEK